ncbi:MAG: hypothetical protein GY707_09705 [Desulfobacteraceae bacterium]|nr:hypothetical protein [Desulfobacteraceae bacterium]
MVVVTACNSNDSKLTVGQKFIKGKQKEIGISCDDLYDNALNFVNLKISKLIETGRAGEDWVALFYKDLQRTV